MKHYFILLFIFLNQTTFSQLPLGKDLKKGKLEILRIMKANNFHYMKQSTGKNYSILLFKEEITISINSNMFENIESLNFSTGNKKIINKVEEIIEFDNWEFAYYETSRFNNELLTVYKINNYFARYYYNPSKDPESKPLRYQYILFNEK
ncbi:hypothetical protein [Tenacibaculum piscium]|uniref:hypothetical protein n=1 Tax=Tenacibaculum piscium TaxID=1458515 RepID=UPI001EFAB93A|nr:hypothetical protein [Tenacibaculum piscium]MCG8183086.1 hypothetical protein [Tenacibaculum piscium]MCG8204730.1 hypothetical protein [Tenacibaculum piscium]